MTGELVSVREDIVAARPTLWVNPARPSGGSSSPLSSDLFDGVNDARDRFARFAPLLANTFADLRRTAGAITSPLIGAEALARTLNLAPRNGRLMVKADHDLAVAGSIKARGGAHAVLRIAEQVAHEHGILPVNKSQALDMPAARELFSHFRISVGSTGNLGLSVGLFASSLGFATTVHMSAAAKAWKKALLRQVGATVIEHQGDYEEAVAAGRSQARHDTHAHFIDDENSLPLLFGYAAAVEELAEQLAAQGVQVDADHPLMVYVPCGVGGAPAGIALGLAAKFGANARCFFVEPVQAPCVLGQLLSAPGEHPSVYDLGLSGLTEADGLAVPRASLLATSIAKTLIDGMITVDDDALFHLLALADQTEGLKLEPSAAAGIIGPRALFGTARGRRYLAADHLDCRLSKTTHLVWTTGGKLLPAEEHTAFVERGRRLQTTPLPFGAGRDDA